MRRIRPTLIWVALILTVSVPIIIAANSPLLAWREPIYVAAGFAGIFAMALMLLQLVLVGGYLPGLARPLSRRAHRWVGIILVIVVMIHVGGLWLTSPPDVIDALLFASPTAFSVWGVIAMWSVFAAAGLAALRHRFRRQPRLWRLGHTALVIVAVLTAVVHALLIEGTMSTLSKAALCVLIVIVMIKTVIDLRVWATGPRPRM